MAVGDVNGDGRLDIVVGARNAAGAATKVFLNDIKRMIVSPAASTTLYAVTADRLLLKSTDGTATWSLGTLQRTLRREAFPRLGGTTNRRVLQDAGSSYQKTRTWCPTGTAERQRKSLQESKSSIVFTRR